MRLWGEVSEKWDKLEEFPDYSGFADDIRKSNDQVLSWSGSIGRNRGLRQAAEVACSPYFLTPLENRSCFGLSP